MKRIHTIKAADWQHHSAPNGKSANLQVQFDPGQVLTFEGRSEHNLVLHAVDENGETVYLDQGFIVRFEGRLAGFSFLQVSYKGSIAFQASATTSRWAEKLDPKPHTVVVKQHQTTGIETLVQMEVQRILGTLQKAGKIPQDTDVDELVKDFAEGDDDFDDDDDDFGFGNGSLMDDDGPDPEPKTPDPKPAETTPTPPAETPPKT